MSEGIQEVSDKNFETNVLESDKPVMVDFWAPWCGPCRAIAPLIEELVKSYPGVRFLKCNVDDNPATPVKYGIKAIPTLIFFKEGKVIDQITGMAAKSKFESILSGLIA